MRLLNPLAELGTRLLRVEPLEVTCVFLLVAATYAFIRGREVSAALRGRVADALRRGGVSARWRWRVEPLHRADLFSSALMLDYLFGAGADVLEAEWEHGEDDPVAPAVFGVREWRWRPDRDMELFAFHHVQPPAPLPRGLMAFVEHPGLEAKLLTPRLAAALEALPPRSLRCLLFTDQFDFAEPGTARPWRGVKLSVRIARHLDPAGPAARALVALLDEAERVAVSLHDPDAITEEQGARGFASRERVARLLSRGGSQRPGS